MLWEWIAAALLVAATVLAMPAIYRAMRRSASGTLCGVALGIGVAFSNLLDPAKRQGTEEIAKQKHLSGEGMKERAGAPADG